MLALYKHRNSRIVSNITCQSKALWLFLLISLFVTINSFAQSTVFFDDFNRNPLGAQGGTPIINWTATKSNPDVSIITMGISGSTTGDRVLQIFNSNAEANIGTPGNSFLTGDLLSYNTLYKSVLKENETAIVWTFNIRSNKGTLNSFNTGNNNYAAAVVLVSTKATLTSTGANGYAVTLLKNNNQNIISLVKFADGLGSDSNISPLTESIVTDNNNYSSVKVTYQPATDNWQIQVLDDGSIDQPVQRNIQEFTSPGKTTTDNTYTSSPMEICGFFYNHGINSKGSSAKAMFDNFRVSVLSEPDYLNGSIKIYVSQDEATPVMLAIDNINRDLIKTTGFPAEIIRTNDFQNIPANSLVVLNNSNSSLTIPDQQRLKVTGEEAHRLYALNHKLYAHGSDMRGTIYALYTFSEKILGVPPLWYWSAWIPVQKSVLEISPTLDIHYTTPQVKYRAWFPNGQDKNTRWRAQSSDNNSAWLEAMLRLKLNTAEIGSVVYFANTGVSRLYSDAELIKSYGLVVSSTHTVGLGTHFSNWDSYWTRIRKYPTAPALSLTNDNALKEFWEEAATTVHNSGLEYIWQMSFRGDNDIPFWETFPNAPESDAERAAIINKMWGYQYEILKRITNNPEPPARITFYNEVSDFMDLGLLTPPQTSNMIWNYVATRRDHYPNDDIRNFNTPLVNVGYYMNLDFVSSGSHLAQGEGPWKMEFNYRFVNSKSPLHFSVINVGNLREYLLSMSANAAMTWNMGTYQTDEFVTAFNKMYYGETYASQITTLYKDFFNAYWQQKKPDFPGGMERQYIFQDLRYKQAIKLLCSNFTKSSYNANPLVFKDEFRYYNIVPEDNSATNQIDAIINGMTASIVKFEDVCLRAENIYNNLPDANKIFFHDNIRSQFNFMSELSKTFLHLASSYKYKWSNFALAKNHISLALHAANRAKDYLYSNQQGVFYDWYAGDSDGGYFDVPDMISRIEKVASEVFSINDIATPFEKNLLNNSDFITSITQEEINILYAGNDNFSIEIFNCNGQSVIKKDGLTNAVSFKHNFKKGIYIIALQNRQGITSGKIIIH